MATPFRRAIVIVMDSVGVGELPDAAAYGDQGSDTVGNIAARIPLKVPTLRSLGIDTQLIIYPNENHGIARPSYQRDRLERYLAWYDKYLKPARTSTSAQQQR